MNVFKKTWLIVVQAAVLSAALIGANAATAGDESVHFVVLGGGESKEANERLQLFVLNLQKEVYPATLSGAYIECALCDDVFEKPGTVRLDFYILQELESESTKQLTRAFEKTKAAKNSNDFKMTSDKIPPDGPDCNGLPSPCNPRPFCTSLGGCSKRPHPYPCQACTAAAAAAGECTMPDAKKSASK